MNQKIIRGTGKPVCLGFAPALLILVLLAACGDKRAALLPVAYEGFDYPASGAPLEGLSAGQGFIRTWGFSARGPGPPTDSHPLIIKESLSFHGLKTSGGACSVPVAQAMLTSTRELVPEFTAQTEGQTRYLGFLLRPEGSLGEGFLEGYFVVGLAGTKGDVLAGRPGGERMDRYVVESSGGRGQVASEISPEVGEPALLVLKFEFKPGADRITLFVNPKPGGPEPKGGAAKTDTDLGEIRHVMLYSTGAHTLDEIRFGAKFEDVTPAR